MDYQTIGQLSEVQINAMKMEFQRWSDLPAVSELICDKRISIIMTAQISSRRDAKVKGLIRSIDMREPSASLSSIDYDSVRDCQG